MIRKRHAHRKFVGLALLVVMGVHFTISLQLFCPRDHKIAAGHWGKLLISVPRDAATTLLHEVAGRLADTVDLAGQPAECSCGKGKRCPFVPRPMLTASQNPSKSEFQQKVKAGFCLAVDRRPGNPTLVFAGHKSADGFLCWEFSPPSSDLSVTCVLLI